MRSIIQEEREECFLCGGRASEEHHIFGGANRRNSEKYGLKIYLCHWCHNEPPNGVHFNRDVSESVKQLAQEKFEETFDDDFFHIFGRNYRNEKDI